MKPKLVSLHSFAGRPKAGYCVCLMLAGFALVLCGCNQRKVAPTMTYDQSQVDTIRAEVKKMDWN